MFPANGSTCALENNRHDQHTPLTPSPSLRWLPTKGDGIDTNHDLSVSRLFVDNRALFVPSRCFRWL